MKKILATTVSMIIALSIVACGKTADKDKNSRETTTTTTKEIQIKQVEPKAEEESSKQEVKEDETIDYADAESFEAALNSGENLEGKIVQFVADELHPNSAFGYNIYSGEHLNFVSSENPNIKVGNTVVVKTTKIESTLGSWIIYYDKIDNAKISDTTIFFDASDSKNEELPLELKETGWHAELNSIDNNIYIRFCGIINNPNEKLIANYPKLKITAKDKDGKILGTEEQTAAIIMPGDTSPICGLFSIQTDSMDGVELNFTVDCSELSQDNSMHKNVRTTDFKIDNVSEIQGDYYDTITGEITNEFSNEIEMANLIVIMRKDGKIVNVNNTFLDDLKVGEPTAFEVEMTYEEHDSVEVYATIW